MATNQTTPPAAPQEEPELFRAQFVYCGHFWNGKTSVYFWRRVSADGAALMTDRDSTLAFGKPQAGAYVGGVYEISFTDETCKSTYLKGKYGPKFKTRWADETEVQRLVLQDRAADVAKRAKTSEKAEMAVDKFREALAPIKAVMKSTDYLTRRAIVALILDELM